MIKTVKCNENKEKNLLKKYFNCVINFHVNHMVHCKLKSTHRNTPVWAETLVLVVPREVIRHL